MSRPYSIPLQNHDDLSKKSYFEINTKIEDNTPNFRTICIYLFALWFIYLFSSIIHFFLHLNLQQGKTSLSYILMTVIRILNMYLLLLQIVIHYLVQ